MPGLTRWFIKASLLFFIASLVTGLVLAARPVLELPAWTASLGPVYFHMFLVGWVTQLIFGVVYWMFPKLSMDRPRGSETLGRVTFVCLNLGLVLRILGEPLVAQQPAGAFGWLLAASAVLQWLGGIGFVANTWGRVKEK